MTTESYTVRGMTCEHCAVAVAAEVGKLPGVTDVQVDVAAGQATVTSEQPLLVDDMSAAVDEAGYELVTA